MSDQRPTIISRIYAWVYGISDFRQSNYIPLERRCRPSSECWYENEELQPHIYHVSDTQPTTRMLAGMLNTIVDRINWLFEVLGKISLTQSEIANEVSTKMDLANNFLDEISSELPINFGSAFTQTYEASIRNEKAIEELLHIIKQSASEIQSISKRLEAVERATGSDRGNCS